MSPSEFGLIVMSFGLLAGAFGIWLAHTPEYRERIREKEARDRASGQ